MTDQAPHQTNLEADVQPAAAATDLTTIVGEVTEAGTVTSVSYTPKANVTGDNTETRTISLINKGADGNGTTLVATLALVTGVGMLDFDEKALTLSATPANLVVAANDVLAFTSTHSGSTGLADPGGNVKVELARS